MISWSERIRLRRMNCLNVFYALAFALLSSCTSQPQKITISLAPQVIVPKIDFGGGGKVFLSIADERPNNRNLEFDHSTIQFILTTSEPIDVILHRSIGHALTSFGFELIPNFSASEAWLKINIIYFEVYDRTARGDTRVQWPVMLAVKALLFKGDTLVFQKEYYIDKVREHGFISAESLITATTNSAVSDLISKIIADLELIAALQSTAN